MQNNDHTVCALIRFQSDQAPGFGWLSGLILRRSTHVPHDSHCVAAPRDRSMVIDIDGARIVVAMDRDATAATQQVVIAVGSAPGADRQDPIAGQRNAFCSLLTESVIVAHDPEDVRWFRDFALPDADLADALLDAARWQPLSGNGRTRTPMTDDRQRADSGTLRTALYAVDEEPDEEASVPMRAALGVMTSVATVASLPVGLAMLAWNGTRGPDLRMTAAGLAAIGLMSAFGDLPMMGLI